MNKLLRKAVLLGIIGFVLGVLIGVTVFYFSGGREVKGITLFYFFIGGVYGLISMGGSVVYDIESWSIARATVTHFVLTVIGFFTLALIQGWFSPEDVFFWIMFVLWVFAYFIIWLCQYLSYLRQVERMNAELREFRKKRKKDE